MTTDTSPSRIDTVTTVDAGRRLGIRTAQVWRLAIRGDLTLVRDERGMGRITVASIEALRARP